MGGFTVSCKRIIRGLRISIKFLAFVIDLSFLVPR